MRALALAAALLAASPVAASDLFEPGAVLCSNYDALTRTCRTITTVTAVEEGRRYAQSRRMVAMPDENLLLETEGVARIEGNRVCSLSDTAEPRFSPGHYAYTSVLISVYKSKRDEKLRRGVCHEYRPCGDGWNVYISFEDEPEPRLVSWTRIFGPRDAERLGLELRYRDFGERELTPVRCGAIG